MEAELSEKSRCGCALRQRKRILSQKEEPGDTSHKNENCLKSINSNFKQLFGFCLNDFRNWNNFVQLMNKPMDSSSLGILRIFFGKLCELIFI